MYHIKYICIYIMCIYILYMCIYIYIHNNVYRERERDRDSDRDVCFLLNNHGNHHPPVAPLHSLSVVVWQDPQREACPEAVS